jgi:hypothetical protein
MDDTVPDTADVSAGRRRGGRTEPDDGVAHERAHLKEHHHLFLPPTVLPVLPAL